MVGELDPAVVAGLVIRQEDDRRIEFPFRRRGNQKVERLINCRLLKYRDIVAPGYRHWPTEVLLEALLADQAPAGPSIA